MKLSLLIKSIILTLFAVGVVAILVNSMKASYVGIRQGKLDENYIRSTDCRVCHEDQYTSWQRTHHRRMTQDISEISVQGDFSVNNRYEYQGVQAKMEKRSNGFYMDLQYPDGKQESYKIERTVGSRRIEQYVAKQNGQYYRLPIAYDLMQKRWMSLNGSFFYPDNGDFKQHFTQWDTNCVFCHNVKAQPNFNFSTKTAKTEVSELGIACGACHGQGASHAEQAASPFIRASWRITEADKDIVHPLDLDTDRAMMICGHCHGQRVPVPENRIREILGKGDPYNAGDDLSQYYRPVHRETKIGEFSFASRFWDNGSPRLTAYEYQGITSSACFTEAEVGNRINCMSCHTMHSGDVKGQITEEKRTNIACTQCHTELNDEKALTVHTKHLGGSEGSSCYACHMPEVVYGVQTIHKTHRITVPDPMLTVRQNVPNACNQCHVDRSANWAIENAKVLWPEHYKAATPVNDEQFTVPETVRGLFGGDALTRALMVHAMRKHGDPDWAMPYLATAFDTDIYPIVRYFAANGLASYRPEILKPDYLGSDGQRREQIKPWFDQLNAESSKQARSAFESLKKLRKDVDLEVGE